MIHQHLITYVNALRHLFFPETCLACGTTLADGLRHVCLSCQLDLPETDFYQTPDNAFLQRFQHRLPVSEATALFYFTHKGRTQKLIHAIKYGGQRDTARYLGQWLGRQMAQAPQFRDVDALVPVPMHPRKQRERGYNQAEEIAKGMATHLNTPVRNDFLIKNQYTASQAQQKLSFLERFENVAHVFEAATIKTARHIVLVDDVMTTGATLEACIDTLHKTNPHIKLSLAVLAYVSPKT